MSANETIGDAAQRIIDELHRSLWLDLWMNGGEMVACPDELQAMPKPGTIEWLTANDGRTKIVRIQDDKIRERAHRLDFDRK